MSEGMIARRGGSSKLFAIISVSYPAGSVCTCTMGSKVLKATDTSGKALFNVPALGTWTVNCTDGSRSKSRTVSINTAGQIENVTLTYELVLFDNGNYDPVAGGWSGISGSALLLNTSAGVGNRYSASASTVNKISFAGYSTLNFQVSEFWNCAENKMGYGTSRGNSFAGSVAISTGTKSISITDQTGDFYINLYITNGYSVDDSLSGHLKVTKVWLT